MYKWTVKNSIHHNECCPAPLCILIHTHKDMTTLSSWLAICSLVYSIIAANVKLHIKQCCVTL